MHHALKLLRTATFFLLNRERDPKDPKTAIIAVGLHLHRGPANKIEKQHNPHTLHNCMGRFMNARSSWNRRRAQRWARSNGFHGLLDHGAEENACAM
jgi:hypothetical protein